MKIKRLMKRILAGAVIGTIMGCSCYGGAMAAENMQGKLIYIPIDNRPITDQYAVDTMEKAGFEVLVPPDELLGGYGHMQGDSQKVWQWLENTLSREQNINAAVISTDTMIYGSLVGSRTHELSQSQLDAQVEKFRQLQSKYPGIRTYLFSSVMRTPKANAAYNGAECSYMDQYAASLYKYSRLLDKLEIQGLTAQEQSELADVRKQIPQDVLQDWQIRRDKNFQVNKELIGLAREGKLATMIIGHDDNAPLSQTHREARQLELQAKGLDKTMFRNMDGIDEIGMLLLARAVNDLHFTMPFIYVQYNSGAGGSMIPSFGSKPIDTTMTEYIRCAGGFYTSSIKRADLVLVMNTTADGKDYFAGSRPMGTAPCLTDEEAVANTGRYLAMGLPTAVVDIAAYNGADNSFMELLEKQGMLFQLAVYGGWNTASNSLGFAIGQGMQLANLTTMDKNDLLMTRYLDDWAYEAVIRQQLSPEFGKTDIKTLEEKGNILLKKFAKEHLGDYTNKKEAAMTLPWKRMFENKVILR